MMANHRSEQNHYKVLGIPEGADHSSITSAYYLQARRLHPDTTYDDDPSSQKFKALAEAYEVLSDPLKRKAYDERLRQQRKMPSHPTVAPKDAKPERWNSELDILAELPITPEEARHGGPCELEVARLQPCACNNGLECLECGGSRLRLVRESMTIQLHPRSQAGALCVVAGKGHGDSQGNRGSLYLRLVVRPCW